MRKSKSLRVGHRQVSRLLLALVAFASVLCTMALNPLAAGNGKVEVIELPGVVGAGNNVAFPFDRYILVAPYAPSKPVDENSDLSAYDNHYLYLFDTKKPNAEPRAKDLKTSLRGDGSTDTLYFPTKLVFDPGTSTAYIRGTRYKETDTGLVGVESLAIVHMNLDDNGKPDFDTTVSMIDIRGIGEDECSDAPIDFALGRDGKLVAFTNGASIYTYDVAQGYVYKVDIVPPAEYGSDSGISYLDIDRASNTLTVLWNKKKVGNGNEFSCLSELSFYKLEDDGSLRLLKRVYPENLPANAYLSTGSNIAISADGDAPDNAYFVASNGSLCQVDLASEGVTETPRVLAVFPELAQEHGKPASPRLVNFNLEKKLIGVVKQGFVTQIRRPSNGRPGRPNRGLAVYASLEEPAVALARLGRKNKVVSSGVFTADFRAEGGLSNLSATGDNKLLVSTYSGNLISIDPADDVSTSKLSSFGKIGSRIEKINYQVGKANLVAINSLQADESGLLISDPGSLIIARFSDGSPQALSALKMETSVVALIGAVPSIRRPLNIKK